MNVLGIQYKDCCTCASDCYLRSISHTSCYIIRMFFGWQYEQVLATFIYLYNRRCFPSLGGIRPSPYFMQERSRRSSGAARRPFYVPSNTWTHDVCVLALVNDEVAPNRDRLDQLKCCGLGKKRITFEKNGDHAYFIKKLEEEFPKLQSQQGAIEVLRSSGGGAGVRQIIPIPMGSQGYSIKDLRSSINSAILYVRPLQTDLTLDQVIQGGGETPKVNCIHCGKEVLLPELRVHNQSPECTLARPGTSSAVDLTSDQTSDTEETDAEFGLQVADDVPSAPVPLPTSMMPSQSLGKLAFLQEMFPSVPAETLTAVARTSVTIDDAVDELVSRSCERSGKTLEQLLIEYRRQVNSGDELNITVERDNLWCNILAFYKKTLTDKARLRKKLVVSFEGEDGVDAGALSAEFFQLALDQIKKRLFQGKPERVLPIKDSTKSMLFQIAGMITAHSLVQGGPGFPCLSPAVYHYMLGKCEDVAFHINKEDIPLTASSEPMVNLIKELEDCDTADDLSNCLSDEHVWNLISACHWPDEVCVTLKNKGLLK